MRHRENHCIIHFKIVNYYSALSGEKTAVLSMASCSYTWGMKLPPRVVLATDHAGFMLKESVKKHLIDTGIDVLDEGTFSEDPVDYPAIIRRGCAVVLREKVPGIIFGGSGIGESIAANKVRGIRAARCSTIEDAELSRKHNDANVMSLGGRMIDPKLANQMVDVFLETDFEGGRHTDRVNDLETNDVY